MEEEPVVLPALLTHFAKYTGKNTQKGFYQQ